MAYAAPEPGARRSKAEYELIAARLDGQLDLLNRKLRALSGPEVPDALTEGDLEQQWLRCRSTLDGGSWRRSSCASRASDRSGLSAVRPFVGADRLDVLASCPRFARTPGRDDSEAGPTTRRPTRGPEGLRLPGGSRAHRS
jgi:hypothetical protein